MKKVNEISAEEFVRRLKDQINQDSKLVFFLGAGCSISSGIPGAGDLVKSWLPRLKKFETGSEEDCDSWVKEAHPNYDENNSASFYGKIIKKLFYTRDGQQQEREKIIEGKDPSFGYAVLAQLMTHERYGRHCNMVITVNFDDLVADALYLYTNKKPLVIAHESLAGFVRITRTRPLVIKLHGDARLEPKNTEQETNELSVDIKKVLEKLLNETGLIFIGYGGKDASIAKLLNDLSPDSLPGGIYWVGSKIPEGEIGEWLKKRNAVWVNHRDFDELMAYIFNEFKLGHPEKARFDKLMNTYFETFKKSRDKVETEPESKDADKLKLLFDKLSKDLEKSDFWWTVELEAEKYKKSNIDKADSIYREGLKKFKDNANLIGNYANFLRDIRKDYDNAEKHYKKALEIDPKNASNLGNYAGFLLSRGDNKGFEFLENSLDLSKDNPSLRSLLLEGLFYQYAHSKDKGLQKRSLKEIKNLLKEEVRSPGWDLSDNVERAVKDGHTQPKFLDKLAKVISEELSIKELDNFKVWQEAD